MSWLALTLTFAAPPVLRCQAQKGSDAAIDRLQQTAQRDALYRFAALSFGAPTACEGSVDGQLQADGERTSIVFHFKDGSSFSARTAPPETAVITVMSAKPLLSLKAIQGLFDSGEAHIDWKHEPDERSDPKLGLVTKTYWSSDGDNIGVDLIYRGKDLVGFASHYAL